MKRFVMMLGLLGGYAYNTQANELNNPTFNSMCASSAEFTNENEKGNNGSKQKTQQKQNPPANN